MALTSYPLTRTQKILGETLAKTLVGLAIRIEDRRVRLRFLVNYYLLPILLLPLARFPANVR